MRGLAFVLIVAACGDDVAPPADGGGDRDAAGGPGPVIPWLMEDGTAALVPAALTAALAPACRVRRRP